VTEHAMSEEIAMKDLRAINELGVELAVDDVGTSWTSFDVLRRMAINTVKIDRSFVGALEAHQGINRMVVETVVSLSHSSGMSTVAEGVETSLQSDIVREFESDAAQGYFFAPPLSLERASELAHTPGYCFALDGEGWMRSTHAAEPVNPAPVEHEPFSLKHGAEAAS
jgi:EAL domain-containing protein (putative c-di-GMP-specific phosphodiesterase class I)